MSHREHVYSWWSILVFAHNGSVYTTCGSRLIQFHNIPSYLPEWPLISRLYQERSMLYIRCWTKSRYRGLASFQIYINSVICISLFIFNSHDKKKWYEPILVVNKRKHDTAFKQIIWSYSITKQGFSRNHSENPLNKNYAIPIETTLRDLIQPGLHYWALRTVWSPIY